MLTTQGSSWGSHSPGLAQVSLDLTRLRGVMSVLGLKAEEVSVGKKAKTSEVRGRMAGDIPLVEDEVEGLVSRRRDVLEPRARGPRGGESPLSPPLPSHPSTWSLSRGYASLAVMAGKIARDVDIPVPHEKFFSAEVEGNFLALFVRAGDRAAVEGILQEARFQPLAIPEGSGSPKQRLGEPGRNWRR